MDAAARQALVCRLGEADVDIAAVAADGGGVWCFGSRAAGCARAESDWDVIVVTRASALEHRTRRAPLDIVSVRLDELDAWASTELAAHVATYGVRIDPGRTLELRAVPAAAAPRKCSVVGGRSRTLDMLWTGLQPAQRRRETLRLRRDLQRAWLLTRGAAIPPTAILEDAWQASVANTRAEILRVVALPSRIARAIVRLDECGDT